MHPDLATIGVSNKDKAITPTMIGVSSSQAHTTAIVKPQSAPGRLLLWDLQTLLPPDASDLGGGSLSPSCIRIMLAIKR